METDTIYDIAFSFDESITPLEKSTLFTKFGSSKKILQLGKSTLKNILGRRWTGTRFNSDYFIDEAKKLNNFIGNSNIKTVRFDDDNYPEGLKQIPDYPFLLYYKGNIQYDYYKSIAIVGTRKPTPHGIKLAKQYTEYLVKNGFTIISGLAEGIDSISHKICCENNSKTIAVLGCGIDRIYPSDNKDIARDILDKNGAIISEYPPGFQPRKWYFPKRNRIIVGLSRGVLIIQAPQRSGSLISAFLSSDYNRDLFVITPQNEAEKTQFDGNEMLINTGATAIHSPDDILKEWDKY